MSDTTELPGLVTGDVDAIVTWTEPDLEDVLIEGHMVIDATLARRILAERTYARQRPIQKPSVEVWAAMIERGEFAGDRQIWFGVLRGRLHLIDGQHRLQGVARSGASAAFQVMLLPLNSMEELHDAYIMFDRVGRKRTTSEVLNSLDVAARYGLQRGTTLAVFQAALLLHFQFRPPHYNADPVATRDDHARLRYVEPWWELAGEYERVLQLAHRGVRRRLLNPQIMAVALATLKHQREKALDFWEGAAADDGLKRGDARKALLNWLSDRKIDTVKLDAAVAASLAWNAWYENRSIETLRTGVREYVRLAGTPFRGKQA
jgi:hypothetical protein